MSPYTTALIVALILLCGFIADLLIAWRYYVVKKGIRGWDAVQKWAGTRAWLLGATAVLYLAFSGVIIFTDVINPSGPHYESKVSVTSSAMSASSIVLTVVLLILICGFAADLLLARRYYTVKRRIKGWEAVRRWAERRSWILGGAVGLYLVFAGVLLITDVINPLGPRYESKVSVTSSAVSASSIVLIVVLLLMLCGFAVDLLQARRYYKVKRRIKGLDAVRRWAERRSWLLGGAVGLYLALAGILLFTDEINSSRPRYESKVSVTSSAMSATAIVLIVVLLILMCGFVADLLLARRYYDVKRRIRGWDAVRRWVERRAWLLGGALALYLALAGTLIFIGPVYLPILRHVGHGVEDSVRMSLTTMVLIVALLILLSGLIMDLLMARRYYDVKRRIRGWEAIRLWAGRRSRFLVGAMAIYLAFAGLLLCIDLRQLPGMQYLRSVFNFLTQIGPHKFAMIAALLLLGGFAVDLMLARRYYDEQHAIKAGDAIRRWAVRRVWFLGGAAVLYVSLAGMLFFTDLIHLPGLRYESKRFVVSANKYLRQRKYREAALELRNALQKNPDDHEIRLTLARTLHVMGSYREAEVEYRAVLAAATASYDARIGLARLLLTTTRKDAALAELREAIRLQPGSAEPHLLLARILRTDGDYFHAMEESRMALTANPNLQEAREQYVATALEGRLYAEALREAEVGRKQNPEDLKMWGYQALALQGLGRIKEADALLREAAAGNRHAAPPWLFMGDLLLLRGEYHAALGCYEEALKREPTNDAAMNNVASLIAEHGTDLTRAHELAAFLNWKYPGNPTYADTLGWVLVKEGSVTQAVPYLYRAVAGLPQSPENHYHLGAALLLTGSLEQGRLELESALRLASDFDGASQARKLLGRK